MARLTGGGVSKAVAITDTFVVTNVSDLTGLTDARIGDIGIVTSTNETYILQADPYSTLSNWVELLSNSVIAGGAVAGNVAYFNNAYTIVGSNAFTWDNTNYNLKISPDSTVAGVRHIVSGESNIVNGYRNIVSGKDNKTDANTSNNIVSGENNYVKYNSGNLVVGFANDAGGNGISGSNNIVGGRYNNCGNGYDIGDMIISGRYNYSIGNSSFITGIYNNITADMAWAGGESNQVGSVSFCFGKNNITNGNYSIVVGESNEVKTGKTHNAAFGKSHVIDGNYNLVGGDTNSVTGFGHIVAGSNNVITEQYNAVFGENNTVGGWNCFAAGYNNTIDYVNQSMVFGQNSRASGQYSIVLGAGARSTIWGQLAHTGNTFSGTGKIGDAQHSFLVAKALTTNDTQTTMTLNYNGDQYIDLENNTTYLFMVDAVARRTDATGERAAYHLEFEANRDANAASTTISTITKNVIHEDVVGWDITATADTTNGRVDIKVTGENGKTIRWVAKVSIIQVKE